MDSWEEDGGGCFCGVYTKGRGGGAGMARGLSLWVALISAGGIVAAVVTIDDAMIGEDGSLLPILPSASLSFPPSSSCSLRVALCTLLPTSLPPILPNDPAVPNSSDDSLRRRDVDDGNVRGGIVVMAALEVGVVVLGTVAETTSSPVVDPTPMVPPPPPDTVIYWPFLWMTI